LGLAGLPVVATLQAKEPRQIVIQSSPIAGFQHHQGEAVWSQLREGMPLELLRQPHNKYDRKAVAVLWQKTQLGYLPRIENHAVCNMLDSGLPLQVRISRLREEANPWRRIEVEVTIEV
jgi:hypothetical protein